LHRAHDSTRFLATTLRLFLTALGLALFLEGAPYFVAPSAVRGYLRAIGSLRDGTLRSMGLGLMAAGLLIACCSRG